VTKKERKNSIMKIDLCIGKNDVFILLIKSLSIVGEEACTAKSVNKNRNVFFF
jgi:hypothetical protein